MKTPASTTLCALVVLPVVKANFGYPWKCPLESCPIPCVTCPEIYTCITEPTVYYYYGLKCPGCPKMVKCGPSDGVVEKQCCDPKLEPNDVECGRSGCTCCGGRWITGNSGPTTWTAEEVCRQMELPVTKVCTTNTDYVKLPMTGKQCGKIQCLFGQECCNESCSICTNPGDSCTQRYCFDN
jgi:hypothetical protein